jgi:hypothetical protein
VVVSNLNPRLLYTRLVDPGALRFTLLASDFAASFAPNERPPESRSVVLSASWTALPPRAIVVVTRDGPPAIETF